MGDVSVRRGGAGHAAGSFGESGATTRIFGGRDGQRRDRAALRAIPTHCEHAARNQTGHGEKRIGNERVGADSSATAEYPLAGRGHDTGCFHRVSEIRKLSRISAGRDFAGFVRVGRGAAMARNGRDGGAGRESGEGAAVGVADRCAETRCGLAGLRERGSDKLIAPRMTTNHESKNIFLNGPTGKLEAVLWTPAHGARPRFAAVVCHPHPLFGGTLHNKVVYQAAKALDSSGGAVLRFNFRGTGLSEGTHDRGPGERDDVRAAVAFLVELFPDVPLVAAGFSFGCWVGLSVGCEEARVQRLIGIGAPVNDSDFLYLGKCLKPKLFVHGSNDEFGDVRKLEEIVSGLPGENKLVVVEDVDHFFKGKIEELGTAISEWMEGWPAQD